MLSRSVFTTQYVAVSRAQHDHVEVRPVVVEVVLASADLPREVLRREDRSIVPVGLLDAPVLVPAGAVDEPDRAVLPVRDRCCSRGSASRTRAVRSARSASARRAGSRPAVPDVPEQPERRRPAAARRSPPASRGRVDRRGGESPVEGLAHDDDEHRAVREVRDRRASSASPCAEPKRLATFFAACAAPSVGLVVEHGGLEVVERRRVRRHAVRGVDHAICATAEEVAGARGRAGDAVAVQHGDRGVAAAPAPSPSRLSPSATDVAFSGASTSGCANSSTALEMFSVGGREVGLALEPLDARPGDVAGGQGVRERGVREHRPGADVAVRRPGRPRRSS